MKILSDNLENCEHIKSIWLGACGLTSKSGKDIAKIISINGKPSKLLNEVWLAGNNLEDSGVQDISKVLSDYKLCSIQRIYLASNKLSVDGCTVIASCVESNPNIVGCVVNNNSGFTNTVKTRIETAQKRNFDLLSKSKKEGKSLVELFNQVK
eukprot:c17675_g1_i3.p1 GENE.c17675_g1_i3~~c17675_g1_i3.p1  ORF type:complete len:153 (+),score=64.53 c17675_g1_i3:721-1179(+)